MFCFSGALTLVKSSSSTTSFTPSHATDSAVTVAGDGARALVVVAVVVASVFFFSEPTIQTLTTFPYLCCSFHIYPLPLPDLITTLSPLYLDDIFHSSLPSLSLFSPPSRLTMFTRFFFPFTSPSSTHLSILSPVPHLLFSRTLVFSCCYSFALACGIFIDE